MCRELLLSVRWRSPQNRPWRTRGEKSCRSTLSLTSALDRGPFPPTPSEKRPGTHCAGGWVGPRTGLDGCGIYRPGIRSADRPARSESLYRLTCQGPNIYTYEWLYEVFFFFLALQPPSGVVFYSPVAGFSLLAYEVSWSHTTTRHSR